MEKEFVPYKIALELKELGFNKPCFGYFLDGKLRHCLNGIINQESLIMTSDHNGLKGNKSLFINYVSAPLFQQVFKWMRKKHGIVASNDEFHFSYGTKDGFYISSKEFESYEKAEIACLIKLIEKIKNKTHVHSTDLP